MNYTLVEVFLVTAYQRNLLVILIDGGLNSRSKLNVIIHLAQILIFKLQIYLRYVEAAMA
jgi:hypothetical protein